MNETEKRLDDFELNFIKSEIEKEKEMILFDFEDMKIKFIHRFINHLLEKNYLKFDIDQYENVKNQIEDILK
jgi:hypothetical protein